MSHIWPGAATPGDGAGCATLTAPEPTSDWTAVSDDQDWRLQAELNVAGDDALDAIVKDVDRLDGEESLVTHDGATLFAYASTQQGLATAHGAIDEALARADADATVIISHWDDRIGDWHQVDPPLDATAQADLDAVVHDAEQVETRTLVATAGRLARTSVEEAMQRSAAELGLTLTTVEHPHLLTTQLAFTVTGPRGRVDQFAGGLQAEGLAMVRAEARVFEPR